MKIALIILLLTGCVNAPERALSPEQDAAIGKYCAAVECVVVPAPIMRQMLEALKGRAL